MEQFIITDVHIQKVRHLENIDIEIAPNKGELRHLILTGKNGSGKTSLLEAMRTYLNSVSTTNDPYEAENNRHLDYQNLEHAKRKNAAPNEIQTIEKRIDSYTKRIEQSKAGLDLRFSIPLDAIKAEFQAGKFILAYFSAIRSFSSPEPKHVEKTNLKEYYTIQDSTSSKFLTYLLDLKMTQALAIAKKDTQKAEEIEAWFGRLQNILRDIYDDPSLQIRFDEDTFKFSLSVKDREPFDFNTASDGFSAILDIIVDLMIRMQRQDRRVTEFLMPGIVLIDEIENHLHMELQRRVLRILTELFPNIQFIITTHSPFVLNSIEKATVYDLENHTLIQDGLSDASYSGIVEGYFKQDELSRTLREKLENYKTLSQKDDLTDDEYAELAILETSLDEIPDYIDLGIATEYKKLKMEFRQREAQR